MNPVTFQTVSRLLLPFGALVILCQCDGPKTRTPVAPPASLTPTDALGRGLDYVRKAHYIYIYVISREDGAEIDREDGAYIKENTRIDANMIYKTDDGRRVIIGSNGALTPENIEALRRRFVLEDRSAK